MHLYAFNWHIYLPTQETCMSMKISLKMFVAGWMTVTWNTHSYSTVTEVWNYRYLLSTLPSATWKMRHFWHHCDVSSIVWPIFWQTGITNICSLLVVWDRKVSHNDVTVKSWSDGHQKIIMWCIIDITFWSLL